MNIAKKYLIKIVAAYVYEIPTHVFWKPLVVSVKTKAITIHKHEVRSFGLRSEHWELVGEVKVE